MNNVKAAKELLLRLLDKTPMSIAEIHDAATAASFIGQEVLSARLYRVASEMIHHRDEAKNIIARLRIMVEDA